MWGASVSAHQVEGNNHNQWTLWEISHSAEQAETAAKRLSWLPTWSQIKAQAQDPRNYISGKGVNHYHQYAQDFDIARQLNLNAMRVGIEWSRLEPEPGQWDKEAIEHYRQYLKSLRSRGIEPVLNLWHWTNPIWFEDIGGFKRRRNLKHFCRFTQKVIEEYGSELKWIITINEPNNYALFGYFLRDTSSGSAWPPGEKNFISLLRVYFNLIRAHKQAYKIIKKHSPHMMVGVAAPLANIQAKRAGETLDRLATKIMRYGWNWFYLNRIRRQQDFVGINYYFTDYYAGLIKRANPPLPVSDMGWYMEPEGLYPVLLRTWKHYKKPILVAENGVADAKDQYRRWWIEETIIAMERAISEGVEVRGYFYWSLLDNFEWTSGWWPKFGLVAVDRQSNMKRSVRSSAKWYGEQIKKLSR